MHGLDSVAHEIEQHLLNLHLLDEDRVGVAGEAEQGLDPYLLGPHQSQRARLFDQLADIFGLLLRFSPRDELAKLANNMARTQGLLGGLGERVANFRHVRMLHRLEQPAAPLQVVGDCRERLVDLMRERGSHLAHGGETRQAGQLGLQIMQLVLGLLPLGEVADEAGKETALTRLHLADFELHGKGRAVLALAGDHTVDADDALLAGGEVAGDIAVMFARDRAAASARNVLADDRRFLDSRTAARRRR